MFNEPVINAVVQSKRRFGHMEGMAEGYFTEEYISLVSCCRVLLRLCFFNFQDVSAKLGLSPSDTVFFKLTTRERLS